MSAMPFVEVGDIRIHFHYDLDGLTTAEATAFLADGGGF
jgi:hypothetical protein